MKHLKLFLCALVAVTFSVSPSFTQTPHIRKRSSEAFQQMEKKLISLRIMWAFEQLRICKEVRLRDTINGEPTRLRYIGYLEKNIESFKRRNKNNFSTEQAIINKKKLHVQGIWHFYHLLKKMTETTIETITKMLQVTKATKLTDKSERYIQKRFIVMCNKHRDLNENTLVLLNAKIKNLK